MINNQYFQLFENNKIKDINIWIKYLERRKKILIKNCYKLFHFGSKITEIHYFKDIRFEEVRKLDKFLNFLIKIKKRKNKRKLHKHITWVNSTS